MSHKAEISIDISDITYKIELSNIKYCTITIIFNKSDDIFIQILRFVKPDEEKKIISTDTIILEHDNETIELDSNYKSGRKIHYKYYSYMLVLDLLPYSIIKYDPIKSFYLDHVEPDFINRECINICSRLFFSNYPQKLEHDESFYSCAYTNIYDNKITFCITKKCYSSNKSATYVLGYNSTILDFEDVKNIINEIFTKKKNFL